MKKINLGDECVDTVTGFKGIVYGKSDFLHGCTRIGLAPKCGKDGKIQETQWFDEMQLKVVRTASKTGIKPSSRLTGGPISSTPKQQRDAK